MRDSVEIFTALALRDGNRCYLCGFAPFDDDPFEIEHIKPRAAGGSDDMSNLKLAHRSCNRIKGTSAVVILHDELR